MDLAVTCTIQDRYSNPDVIPAEKYAQVEKHGKYDDKFEKTDVLFIAAFIDTFGGWTLEGMDLITEIARRGAKRLMVPSSEYMSLCWAKFSTCLQTDVARQIMSKLGPLDPEGW